jgi:hypothetical protein
MLRAARPLLPALLLAALLPACVVIDVRGGEGESGVRSHGFIGGYATAGWPADDSILKIGVLDGPSPGSILYVQLWKFVRAEVGFLGVALGIGPLDAGFGVLLYDPQPPSYVHDEEPPAPKSPPAAKPSPPAPEAAPKASPPAPEPAPKPPGAPPAAQNSV